MHFSIILIVHKNTTNSKFPQKLYDNIFLNIEYHLREQGLGDMSINKKMKNLNKIFYDILLKINILKNKDFKTNKSLLEKYLIDFCSSKANKFTELADYFNKFYDFCFEMDNETMLKGDIKFNI